MWLIPAKLYEPIVLLVVAIYTLIVYLNIRPLSFNGINKRQSRELIMLIFISLFVLFVGLRPISPLFGDTGNYAMMYNVMSYSSSLDDSLSDDFIFNSLMFHCSKVMPVTYFFLIIEILYVVPIYLACRKLAGHNSDIMMLFCFGAFSFFSYGVNGIRNGMACSLIILAISLVQGKMRDKIIGLILCLISIGCHRSTFLPVICMFAAMSIKKPKIMFYFWILSIFVSLVAGPQIESFFVTLGFDDRMDAYLNADKDTMEMFSSTGFRWDFLLYSCVPIVLGWYLIFKRRTYNRTYLLLLGTYVFANAFWIMVIRASFSNRFAYLSWFIYPIVLSYPLLKLPIWKNTQGRNTGLIMLGHYFFTLLMFLIGK